MRVLMLSCNTGEGHNSTAYALREVLQERGAECTVIDVLGTCISLRFSKFITKSHIGLYKYAPRLWDVGYRVSDRKQLESDQELEDNRLMRELLHLGARRLEKLIREGGYDTVVCVHMFSGVMMSILRRWGMTVPCYFVATDYTCSPLVDQSDADGYFIPAADLQREFAADGVDPARLIPTGIPVRQAFYQRVDRLSARRELKLPEEGTVVLMMCGSMGCGPIRRIVKKLSAMLPGDATLVAICGRNEKLYEDLTQAQLPKVRVLGYCDQIPLYMDASDLVVTKPGGLSSTEAAVKHLPMVFINAVGGCEAKNFTYFLTHGYALGSDESREVADLVAELVACPAHMERMRAVLEKDFSSNSAREIVNILMQKENSSEIS